jgi:hypothetical protein
MCFGGTINDRLYPMIAENLFHKSGITNVAADEGVTRVAFDLGEVLQIAGVA